MGAKRPVFKRVYLSCSICNLRFQELYWNVRDELGYLEPMRRQLAKVLQKQAGSLPSVTLSSNLLAQVEVTFSRFSGEAS